MTTKLLDSPLPRYAQLADLMRQRISRGIWPCGCRIPSLEELASEFGVARATVRQSIDILARQGLLIRQRGRGTFVISQPANDRHIRVVTTLDALATGYEDIQPTIVHIDEPAVAPVIHPGEGTPAQEYVYMRRVHSRNKQTHCVIDIYVDEAIFRRQPERFRTEAVIPLLMAQFPKLIAKAHQYLTISTADMEIAKLLGVQLNAPVAEVRRIFQNKAGVVIYLAEVVYRGESIRLDIGLIP